MQGALGPLIVGSLLFNIFVCKRPTAWTADTEMQIKRDWDG